MTGSLSSGHANSTEPTLQMRKQIWTPTLLQSAAAGGELDVFDVFLLMGA